MSDGVGKLFKDWMVATGKSKNTANNYFSGVNTVSKHSGCYLFQITALDELERLCQRYGPEGEFAMIGAGGNGTVWNGLKQWLEYQRQLQRGHGFATGEIVIEGYADHRVEQLLNKGNFDQQAWLWTLLKCFRQRYPQADHWTVNITPPDIRIGVREKENLKGRPAFSLYWYGGEFQCSLRDIAGHRAAMESSGLEWWIDSKGHPALADMRRWLDSVDNTLPDRQLPLNGAGLMPSDYQEPCVPLPHKTLNQILYGPPGTGKTYETIRAALSILDPAAVKDYDAALAAAVSLEEKSQAREALKARFDQFCAEDRIRFVTFHQSFSYEDFVEGLRAESTEGQVQYRVEPGVFLRVCKDAAATPESVDLEVRLERFIDEVAETPAMLATATGKLFKVSYRAGNTTLTCEPQSSESDIRLPASIEQVHCELAGRPVENPYCSSYVKGIAAHLRQQQPILQSSTSRAGGGKPYVLIIDEINRGNISRIFGELITLIEPSKRAGAAEALEVMLPYSKQPFKVPGNVYLIGTMNTADRSLAGLDLALRRRFTFTEMPPKPELLDGVEVEGVNIGQMLRVMNQRITVLLDRDHTLGHAYFMPLQDDPSLDRLSAIFRQSILPLLQEYFFEDWERIRWVLNDQSKPEGAAFIVEDRTLSLAGLFPGVHDKLRPRPQWRVNVEAFDLPAAYAGIVGARSETQHNPPVATAPSEMAAVG